METPETSIFSFIVVNLVNKGILHFLITNGLSADCSTKEFIHRFFGRALQKNHENAKCINFQFHNLKFSQQRYFGLYLNTATDICMKEVIHSCLRRAL